MELVVILVVVIVLTLAVLNDGSNRGCVNSGCGWLLLVAVVFCLFLALAGAAGVSEVRINAPPAAPGVELRR